MPARRSDPIIEPDARPFQYKTTAQWLRAGLDRQRPAVIGALVAAWTGLPFALWIAIGGLVLGALAGAVGASSIGGVASSFTHTSGFGVLGGFAGALLGAVAGLLLIYIYLFLHPIQLVGALASGVVLSTIVLVVMVRAEPVLMRLRGYREPSRRERARLHPLLVDTARRMGLEVVPDIWISDQQKPGAWAHVRGIVVTRGLLGDYDASEAAPKSELNEAALGAILAHELQHWDASDVVGTTMIAACFWPYVLIVNSISWIRLRGEWLGILLWCVFWPVWVTTKFVVVPLMTARARQCEYEADARAASLGDDYRLELRRALDELSAWEQPRTGWEDVLAATHPPIEHRLERLEATRKPEPEPARPVSKSLARTPRAPRPSPAASPNPAAGRTSSSESHAPDAPRPTTSALLAAAKHRRRHVEATLDEQSVNDAAVSAIRRMLTVDRGDAITEEIAATPYQVNLAVLRKLQVMREAIENGERAGLKVTLDDLDRWITDYDMAASIQAEAISETSTKPVA